MMSAIAGAAVDSPMTNAQLDQLSINCIRTLSIDAVQQAKSGHPGTPMALAPLVYTLWNRVMQFDPEGSDLAEPRSVRALQRSCLDAAVVGAPSHRHPRGERRIRTARASRRSRSTTSRTSVSSAARRPGHPEYHLVSGVEATTGPLGQGVATSVGMAIAETWLADRYNRPDFEIFGYNIYAICGDGCMMEGVVVGSGFARGPSRLGQPLLDLRQQPHHDRRQHAHRLHGRHRGAVHGVRLERSARRRRQRHRAHRAGPRDLSTRPRGVRPSSFWTAISATARRTSRTPPRRMASRSARKRFASPNATTDGPRTPSSWFRPPCPSTSPPESARVARKRHDALDRAVRRLTGRNIRSSRPRST